MILTREGRAVSFCEQLRLLSTNFYKMIDSPNVYISSDDHQALSLLLKSIKRPIGTALKLRDELTRAVVLDDAEIPPDAVGINSEVHLEDLDSGEAETYTLALPSRANPDFNRISVLAPLGVALIGVLAGARFEWNTPGGLRRLRIVKVVRAEPKPTVHGPYSLS